MPTARYERPPAGVDPSVLNEPAPAPTAPTAPGGGAELDTVPRLFVPQAPVVRRRASEAPTSLETTSAQPRERPWERPAVGAPQPPLRATQPAPAPVAPPKPPPDRRVAAATPAPPPRPASRGRMIELQIGAFADRGNAEKAARTARAAGPTRIQTVEVNGVTYHRVIVGPAGEADLRAALQGLGFRDTRPLARS